MCTRACARIYVKTADKNNKWDPQTSTNVPYLVRETKTAKHYYQGLVSARIEEDITSQGFKGGDYQEARAV